MTRKWIDVKMFRSTCVFDSPIPFRFFRGVKHKKYINVQEVQKL